MPDAPVVTPSADAPAQPAATTPSSAPTVPSPTGSAGAGFDWKSGGVDDIGLNLVAERQWKNPGDLLTSYVNLEKVRGVPLERLVTLPKDNDPKAWNDVYTKLGRPETADKYVIPVPEGDKGEFAGVAKTWFHESGLSQAQATKLAEHWNKFQTEQATAQTAKVEQEHQISVNDLKKAWGADYDANASVVDRAAETFGMTQDQLSALKQVMGPKGAMTFLHNIGSKIAVEDASVPGLGGKGSFGMSPDAAKAAIEAKKRDPLYAQLFNSSDPKQRMEVRQEMDRLHQLAYPGSTEYAGVNKARA